MAVPKTYLGLRMNGKNLVSVTYSFGGGVEIEEGPSRYMRAAYNGLRDSYNMVLTAPKPVLSKPDSGEVTGKSTGIHDGIGDMYRFRSPEEAQELANKHFIRLMNDIEKKVFGQFSENPFGKIATMEEVDHKQTKLNSDSSAIAKLILSDLVEEHRKAGLKPDLVTYLALEKHVSSKIRSITSELAVKRRNELRELKKKKRPVPPVYRR